MNNTKDAKKILDQDQPHNEMMEDFKVGSRLYLRKNVNGGYGLFLKQKSSHWSYPVERYTITNWLSMQNVWKFAISMRDVYLELLTVTNLQSLIWIRKIIVVHFGYLIASVAISYTTSIILVVWNREWVQYLGKVEILYNNEAYQTYD